MITSKSKLVWKSETYSANESGNQPESESRSIDFSTNQINVQRDNNKIIIIVKNKIITKIVVNSISHNLHKVKKNSIH